MTRSRLWNSSVVLTGAAFLACSEQPRATPTDTADATASVVESPPPPATPTRAPESKIGLMPILRPAVADGTCRVGASEVERRVTYESHETPKRSITVGASPAAREFAPTFLEVRASQVADAGVDEIETLYVIFSPTGQIETGTRQYFTTAANPNRERQGLLPGDTAAAKQVALYVLDRCKPEP